MQLSSSVYVTHSCSALVFWWCFLGWGRERILRILLFPTLTRCKINGCKTSNPQLSCNAGMTRCAVPLHNTPVRICPHSALLSPAPWGRYGYTVRDLQIGIHTHFFPMHEDHTHMPVEFWLCMQLCAYRHTSICIHAQCTTQLHGPFQVSSIHTGVLLPMYMSCPWSRMRLRSLCNDLWKWK